MLQVPKFAAGEQTSMWIFLRNNFIACFVALLVGSLVDNAFALADGPTRSGRGWAALLFMAQLTINIGLLMMACWIAPWFLSWIQLSISGLLASVLLFLTQEHLVISVLKFTQFT